MLAADLPFSFSEFEALRELIHAHSGIWLNDSKRTFLQVRLSKRLRARNISSVQEYYYFLKYDPGARDELEALIDAVTVNETWFFRETGPVNAWQAHVLPALLDGNGRVRLWSAGCATGEEPYTLAMLLLDGQPGLSNGRVEIIASDISQQALATARVGLYDPYKLRHTHQRWLDAYFANADDGQRRISPAVQRLVCFQRANLTDPRLSFRVRAVDVILCRNVIIYFDKKSRQAALANFHRALKPGGHLILGHSESLVHSVSPFEIVRLGGNILYRKPV